MERTVSLDFLFLFSSRKYCGRFPLLEDLLVRSTCSDLFISLLCIRFLVAELNIYCVQIGTLMLLTYFLQFTRSYFIRFGRFDIDMTGQ